MKLMWGLEDLELIPRSENTCTKQEDNRLKFKQYHKNICISIILVFVLYRLIRCLHLSALILNLREQYLILNCSDIISTSVCSIPSPPHYISLKFCLSLPLFSLQMSRNNNDWRKKHFTAPSRVQGSSPFSIPFKKRNSRKTAAIRRIPARNRLDKTPVNTRQGARSDDRGKDGLFYLFPSRQALFKVDRAQIWNYLRLTNVPKSYFRRR